MSKPIELKVEGMTCNNCAMSLSKYLKKMGYEDVYVNFSTKEVRFDPANAKFSVDQVEAGIKALGFKVLNESKDSVPSFWTLEKKLLISTLFTLPLFLGHILIMLGMDWLDFLDDFWIQFGICLPVFTIGVFHFGKSAWGSLKGGVPNMDVLIFTGSTAAFVYSFIGTLQGNSNYIFYETAATIITLVLLGNYMEKRAVDQTTTAIDELANLKVTNATKLNEFGMPLSVPVKDLQIGDKLQINEGDSIPLDSKILVGQGTIDQSMITGESLPVDKNVGETVIGATLLASGNIQVEVTAVGTDTVLGKMIELVKSAQQQKPSIQRLADKISAIFVPAVLIIALLTFFISVYGFGIEVSQALMNSIAVLVISCPCAMGLATPTAVMVGVGRVAKNGILIKGGQTLETFAKIKNIVFDKTGTLTTGQFKIKKIDYLNNDESQINSVIYQLENHSSHPIAKSLVTQLGGLNIENKISLEQVHEERGLGVSGKDKDGNKYQIGSSKIALNRTEDLSHNVYLLKNDQIVATIDLEDEIKKDARSAIDYLRKEGINTILLSGDQHAKVNDVAIELGIREYYGEQLPEQKLKEIDALNKTGLTAMVGDGINDAPALAKADIGVSLSDASQAAIQSAEIVLLDGKLGRLSQTHAISKQTLLTIKQNLFWAFAYNIVAIPIAALGFLNPMWGALFMAFSDVIVIGNSIRLKYKKIF